MRNTERSPKIRRLEAVLDELRRDSEVRLGRKVLLDSSAGKDGTLRAELKVADISRQRAHIYANWESAEYTFKKSEREPTEAEKERARIALDRVTAEFADVGPAGGGKAPEAAESRFVATGGRHLGTSLLTGEQRKMANEISDYLRHINGPSDAQGDYYRTFARLVYSESEDAWDVRICPAAIRADCDPSVDHGCADGKARGTMFANSWNWYGFVSESLNKPGIGKVYIAFGRLHEI